MTERQITVQREVAEQEVKVDRENVIINDIGNITGVFPEGTKEITENGTYDVTTEKYAEVSVPGQDELFNRTITKDYSSHFIANLCFVKALPTFIIDSSVTDLSYAFSNLQASYGSVDLRIKLIGDGTNVLTLSYLFNYGSRVVEIDLSEISFPNVVTLERAFRGLRNLQYLDVSKCLSGAKPNRDMNGMFEDAVKLERLVLPDDWDTSQAPNMNYAFINIGSQTEGGVTLDLTSVDTSSITTDSQIFSGAKFKALILGRQQVFKLTATNCISVSAFNRTNAFAYVPDNLVEAYKSDTYWSAVAAYIKPLSEYVEEE